MTSWRWVDTDVERARWRGTVNFRALPRVQLGVEINPVVGEVGPLVTAFLLTESWHWPGVFVGTSSDRIGSPEGKQSYYVTATKAVPNLPVSGYAAVNWSEWDEHVNFPFGLTVGRAVSLTSMYDGERTHLLLNAAGPRLAGSLMWVWLEQVGLSVSTGF